MHTYGLQLRPPPPKKNVNGVPTGIPTNSSAKCETHIIICAPSQCNINWLLPYYLANWSCGKWEVWPDAEKVGTLISLCPLLCWCHTIITMITRTWLSDPSKKVRWIAFVWRYIMSPKHEWYMPNKTITMISSAGSNNNNNHHKSWSPQRDQPQRNDYDLFRGTNHKLMIMISTEGPTTN